MVFLKYSQSKSLYERLQYRSSLRQPVFFGVWIDHPEHRLTLDPRPKFCIICFGAFVKPVQVKFSRRLNPKPIDSVKWHRMYVRKFSKANKVTSHSLENKLNVNKNYCISQIFGWLTVMNMFAVKCCAFPQHIRDRRREVKKHKRANPTTLVAVTMTDWRLMASLV